jgi:hypothetical protein
MLPGDRPGIVTDFVTAQSCLGLRHDLSNLGGVVNGDPSATGRTHALTLGVIQLAPGDDATSPSMHRAGRFRDYRMSSSRRMRRLAKARYSNARSGSMGVIRSYALGL